ncbi:ParA family protein [Chengkuizengella axinellae]|uniref:ParA family protein n=1 Tax=Chengkuizengella axinellae TaxID=3064388 RepID=A0ABT9J399_9BACL|nr:ParA family protein [Chengkuizengella sp. 2205SS18-9]MDP5276096.1 ParA family protein [Chengkuizengella sp. 2205SS18-9]
MAITISFGIQKGGVGKTTSTGITSYLLSQESKVLAVDFDSQGNLTSFLTQQNIYDFTEKTVLEAVKEKDPRPYIHQITDTLHILPAEDFLSTLPQYIYRTYNGNPTTLLKETLDVVDDQYDYILIDLPPNLGDHTINGLSASDFAVVLLQSEPFCYDALERYLQFLQSIKSNTNPDLVLAGILTSMLDGRTTLDASILEQSRREYEDIVFDSTIRRRSRIKEFTITGIMNQTKADKEALTQYVAFTEELKKRVQ